MNGLPLIVSQSPSWSPGLGCACNTRLNGVSDYDIIRIGGGNYTANQIVDKYIRANATTKLYQGTTGAADKVIGTVKGGEIIGKVWSYLRPDQSSDGRSWLMFERTATQIATQPQYGKYFYVPNEAAGTGGLKDQGVKTVTEEVKQEEEEKLKLDSPIEYYIKKYAGKVILAVGAIVLLNSIAKESIKGSFSKKESSPQTTT